MAETAAAKPVAKPAAPAPVLREVMPKKFGPSSLQPVGQDFDILTVPVPADWSYADVLKTIAWGNVAPRVASDQMKTQRDRIGSLIQAHHKDFYAILIIHGIELDNMKNPAGLYVTCIGPSIDPKTGKACPVNVKTGEPWIG